MRIPWLCGGLRPIWSVALILAAGSLAFGQAKLSATALLTPVKETAPLSLMGIPVPQTAHPAYWSNGFFIVRAYDQDPEGYKITVYRPDGTIASQGTLSFPDASTLRILDAQALRPDGALVASFASVSTSGQRAFGLAFLDGSGVMTAAVRTDPFKPQEIGVAPDGSIWAFGVDAGQIAKSLTSEFMTLEHFSSEGQLLGKFVPRSVFTVATPPPSYSSNYGESLLRVSKDRIGLYNSASSQWIEIGFKGNLLGSWTVPFPGGASCPTPKVGTLVMTGGDAVFARIFDCADANVFELDRARSQWVKVDNYNNHYAALVGADGEQVVTKLSSPAAGPYAWFSLPSKFAAEAPPPR